LTVHLPEDLEKLLRAEFERGRLASIAAAVDLALRRLLKPPSEGLRTEEELHSYMYEIGMMNQRPQKGVDLEMTTRRG